MALQQLVDQLNDGFESIASNTDKYYDDFVDSIDDILPSYLESCVLAMAILCAMWLAFRG